MFLLKMVDLKFNIEKYLNSLPDDIQCIDISYKNLTYVPSLKRFYNLKHFDCSKNRLTQLPELNDCLEFLNCASNQLSLLPELNRSLDDLICDSNKLTELPNLTNCLLTQLSCGYNRLTQLPELNNCLIYLSCNNNKLTQLPELNASLKVLCCNDNKLTHLPRLNDYLERLDCSGNKLKRLPKLNNSLRLLYCFENKLTYLPELNDNLVELYCADNKLIQLPNLNSSLEYFEFDLNHLPVNFYCYAGTITIESRDKLQQNIRCLERFKELYYLLKFKTQFRDLLWLKVRLPRIQKQFCPDHLEKFLYTKNEEDFDKALDNW